MFFDVVVVVVVCEQALHGDTQNVTQQVNCLLPFVPLRKLTETLNGEAILRDISLYKDILWSPQQVHIFTLICLCALFKIALT